jgi:hypothetical protein
MSSDSRYAVTFSARDAGEEVIVFRWRRSRALEAGHLGKIGLQKTSQHLC